MHFLVKVQPLTGKCMKLKLFLEGFYFVIIFTFGKYAAKRKTVGISGSKFYSKVKAGGAYILNTAGNVIVRMPI